MWMLVVTTFAQAQEADLHQADSLFLSGRQAEAEVIYEKHLSQVINTTTVPIPIYYKLAYINEKQNDFARTLYYLSMIYNKQPRQNILNKIKEVAANNNLSGYEVDDFSFVFLFFRKYSLYFDLFLLIVAIYAFWVLNQKRARGESIRSRHKFVVIAYLIALLMLLNLPDSYQIAIINKGQTYLRDAPSSAAPVKWSIARGNKVTVIGESDEWLRIWWEKQPLYVRKLDVWRVR
ncbi:hypothetical protein Runsl_4944 [Runella slithyformis DSM 19594]|uniref:SH3 domain-containing protein n=2 Tax=Runella TaxID=105 RepID=A0A7U4E8H3_RUNSL|nr:hypothetical protein Runsl_4944 [Runella slithyformis DSM 19594]